jgi:hypothetical protein
MPNQHDEPIDPPAPPTPFSRPTNAVPPTTLPSGEPTVARRQHRYRNEPPDPNAPLAVALAGVGCGIVGLLASFFACAFVIDLIGGIMSINALATRKTSDNPGFVTLLASGGLLLMLTDIVVLGMRFSNME